MAAEPSDNTPLVELDPDGAPSVLNYNVPEPTSYTGRNLMELPLDPSIFRELVPEEVLEEDNPPNSSPDDPGFGIEVLDWAIDRFLGKLPRLDDIELPEFDTGPRDELNPDGSSADGGRGDLRMRRDTGRRLRSLRFSQPAARRASGQCGAVPNFIPVAPGSNPKPTPQAPPVELSLLERQIASKAKQGAYPYLQKTVSGASKMVFSTIPERPFPGLYLVETYRLSSFLGDYGAGKTVKTFSLLPGEKTNISITTYRNTTETTSESNSIFDSYTESTEDDFESTVQSENSSTDSQEKTTEWYVDAEAEGNWGVASASASAGASGSTNSAREDFAKNVNSATEKHSQIASSTREVNVNTNTSSTVETGTQTAIEREIQNINVGRTLNFVFRQLNQEYISLLHLVDVRVGFFNGFEQTRREEPLHRLDDLLKYCVTNEPDRTHAKNVLIHALENVLDYQNDPVSDLLEDRSYAELDGSTTEFKVVNRKRTQTYDPLGRSITVPGVIMNAQTVTLRTDAVIVEALLGQAPALDDYSEGLQEEKVTERALANGALELGLEERRARLAILEAGDAAAAQLYATLFPQPSIDEEG